MSKPAWFERANKLHEAIVFNREKVGAPGVDSEDGICPYDNSDGIFLAMKLAEEAGEVAGEFSKWMRGDNTTQVFVAKLTKELADVRCMLELIAHFADVDLDEAVKQKLTEVEARWREKGVIP